MSDNTIFKLTVEDFETVLGRKMTSEEVTICKDKFDNETWWDDVECFLEVRGIK